MIWDKKDKDKVAPLTSEQAKTLLKIGDRETIQYVAERAKSGTREASITEATLIISAESQEGLDKLLADNGLSRKAINASGFQDKMDTKNVTGTYELAIPMADIEKIAGISWEAANPAIKHMTPKGRN